MDPVKSTAAAAGNATRGGGASECGKTCFAAAKKLGMDRVAADSLACFMTHKGKLMSHYDCCDKAELLLGARGKLASCELWGGGASAAAQRLPGTAAGGGARARAPP